MNKKKSSTAAIGYDSIDQARWDAEALARAEEIRADRSRLSAAQGHARKEAQKYAKIGATRTAVKSAPSRKR